MSQLPMTQAPLELWGGIECTVNRVQNTYLDQIARSGHSERIEDLERIAELGIQTLRYPVLWEWSAKNAFEYDWSWADERLNKLRALSIQPIVGLVHHGSGPAHTSLIDEDFPTGLANYAGALAERFPWVDQYTPVNEPLTTARFSGLYGHWYPHGKDAGTFARALIHQCRAVVLSMQAIRKIRPDAKLIQTEDLGKTYSTPSIRYQADFENERRWLTFDLLSGHLHRNHSLWNYLRWAGIAEKELTWFLDNPCPPNIIGINYYVTSERFLDDRLDRYPPHTHGGNHQHQYADIEAIRVGVMEGPKNIFREAWQRYHLPLAITEVHLGCTREEQMRWLLDIWRAANTVRQENVDIRAVTVWSLLGAFDWDSLVTRSKGHYEPGTFDLRGSIRPTALAGLVRELALGLEPSHPVLTMPGWWCRPERLSYPPMDEAFCSTTHSISVTNPKRPILFIVDPNSSLGRVLVELCEIRGLEYHILSPNTVELRSRLAIESVVKEFDPWAVVHVHLEPVQLDANSIHSKRSARASNRLYRSSSRSQHLVYQNLETICFQNNAQFMSIGYHETFKNKHKNSRMQKKRSQTPAIQESYDAEPFTKRQLLSKALEIRLLPESPSHDLPSPGSLVCLNELGFPHPDFLSPFFIRDFANECLDLLIDGEHGIWSPHLSGSIVKEALAQKEQSECSSNIRELATEPCSSLHKIILTPWKRATSEPRKESTHPVNAQSEI